ncbi:MAG: hypothetical protein IJE91_02340 [Clostridia bacterium]|nr:hypothetical protein [Clostridia bacterium]
MIKALKPLVMMQLKDKLDLSYLKSFKQTITKVILSILAFAIITVAYFALFYVSKLFRIFHLVAIIPVSVIVVIFTIMETLALLTGTYSLMKSLYFAKDNPVLLTMPVSTNQVFLSKLIVFFVYEMKRTLYFLVPLFLAYGITAGLPIYFYFWLIVCWFLISVFNVSFASLFSILAMAITMFLRNFNVIRILIFLGIVGVAIYALVTVINMIPADFDIRTVWGTLFWQIQDFLNMFTKLMWPFTYLTQLIVGDYIGILPRLFTPYTLKTILYCFALIIAMFALAFLISRPLFFKMAAKPFEYRKVTRDFKRKNKKTNSFLSAVKAQALLILRTSDDLFALMGCAVAMPILILLLNRIFAAMSTKALGDYMTACFNMLIILLVALASNTKIASIYSREGAAAYLNKTRPNEYRTNLIAKLVPNAVVITISIITSVSIFAGFSTLNVVGRIFFSLTAIVTYLMHLLWCAETDVMNPQTSHYATTGDHPNNPNETKSTITMFIVSFAVFLVGLFLSVEDVRISWIKVGLVCIALFAYRIWSYLSKIKYFYKEK